MKPLNKLRLLVCIGIAFIINTGIFISQYNEHSSFQTNGITQVLFVKGLRKHEATFAQKFKYTKVAKIYFITTKGDTIFDFTKNTWAYDTDVLEDINMFLPIDSVIYDSNNPKDYQKISEYRSYSMRRDVLWQLLFGSVFFTVWLYVLTTVVSKGIAKFKNKRIAGQ